MTAKIVKKLLDSEYEGDVLLGIQFLYKLTPEEIETFWKFRDRGSDYTPGFERKELDLFILYEHLFVYHGFIQNWGKWEYSKDSSFKNFNDLTPDEFKVTIKYI